MKKETVDNLRNSLESAFIDASIDSNLALKPRLLTNNHQEGQTIHVVAAIIRSGDKIFATQRGYGDFKDGWEFPGGKIEEGETPQDALAREIREELEADIIVGEHLVTVEHDYPNFHLSMQCFWAELREGTHMTLLEHEAAKWLSFNELDSVDWLPADIDVVRAIKKNVD